MKGMYAPLIFKLSDSPHFVHGQHFTDADLAQIPADSECVSLENSLVTDAGLAALARLERIRCLDLDGTGITDAALVPVAELTSLEELWLEGTAITDAGLRQLGKLDRLRFLSVLDCENISNAAVSELQLALPSLDIVESMRTDA